MDPATRGCGSSQKGCGFRQTLYLSYVSICYDKLKKFNLEEMEENIQ